MHRGKGMKFVGDSRVPAPEVRTPKLPKDYSEYPGKTEAFWPNFLLKEWMVGAVFLVGFLCLTIAHPAPLERIADPTDTSYIPLPDWYFYIFVSIIKIFLCIWSLYSNWSNGYSWPRFWRLVVSTVP